MHQHHLSPAATPMNAPSSSFHMPMSVQVPMPMSVAMPYQLSANLASSQMPTINFNHGMNGSLTTPLSTSTPSSLSPPIPGTPIPTTPTVSGLERDQSSTFHDFDVGMSNGRIVTDSFESEAESIIRALEEAMETRRTHDVPSLGIRTPVETLAECDNPLEKDGRNTVI